jgi:DNA mismatch endonuclease, patch repair protein
MRRISGKNTAPEMLVRRLLHAKGFRYRLHVPTLPGKPDLVFAKLRKVIFVHGCFWHLHEGCNEGRIPQSRRDYWEPKLLKNVERDQVHLRDLRAMGWKTLCVWECELKHPASLERQLIKFLTA